MNEGTLATNVTNPKTDRRTRIQKYQFLIRIQYVDIVAELDTQMKFVKIKNEFENDCNI